MLISGSWGGVGWGGDNSNPVYGYATRSSLALHATLHDLHLHFMLRYKIYRKNKAAEAFAFVGKNPNRKSSCLLTDGAPCYPKVAKECRAKHFFVNHRAGEFQRAERFRNRALSVHTGTIDSCWAQMKNYIPKSLSPQSKQIPLRIRSWQWRFTHAAHDNLFQLCGTQVAKL